MKRPAVFFDRDNTLIANDGYLGDPDGVVLVAGAADLVARVRRLGYVAVTISNQSGVARGLFTEQDVHRVNSRLDEMLLDHEAGAVIDRHEFCPHHPEAAVPRYRQASEFRKPAPGMIYQAARQLELDLSRSWVVGDTPRDIEAGRAAGCRTILFKDPALPKSAAASDPLSVEPDFVAASLREVADFIENNPASVEEAKPAAVTEVESVGPAVSAELETPVVAEAVAAGESPRDEPVEDAAESVPAEPPSHVVQDDSDTSKLSTDAQVTVADAPCVPSLATQEEGRVGDFASDAVGEAPSPALPRNTEGGRESATGTAVASPIQGESRPKEIGASEQEHASPAPDRGLPAAAINESDTPEAVMMVATVEVATSEEQFPEQGTPPQSADEQNMDDRSARGPASDGGEESDGTPRRRTPPAVILAAKAARAAARNSEPDASPEVLREVARNAARAAAMGITIDYSAPATTTAPSTVSPAEPAEMPHTNVTDSEPSQPAPAPQEPVAEQIDPELTEPAEQATAPDESYQLPPAPTVDLKRLEDLTEQILVELRQRNDAGADFSVSKLMAGIIMVISLPVLVYAYLYKNDWQTLQSLLLFGVMLQSITISLLIMGRQK